MDIKTSLISILFVLFMLLFISACTTQHKSLTMEDARQLAADTVLRSDAYTQYDAYDFTEDYAVNLSCPGCYEFEYSFRINSTELNDTQGFVARVSLSDDNITKIDINPVQNLFVENSNCTEYDPDKCPQGCIVCPPCAECDSIKCQNASVCINLGFDAGWYNFSVLQADAGTQCTQPVADDSGCSIPIADRYNGDTTCKNLCGNGLCEDTVCQDPGCPCEENKTNCPEDCG